MPLASAAAALTSKRSISCWAPAVTPIDDDCEIVLLDPIWASTPPELTMMPSEMPTALEPPEAASVPTSVRETALVAFDRSLESLFTAIASRRQRHPLP